MKIEECSQLTSPRWPKEEPHSQTYGLSPLCTVLMCALRPLFWENLRPQPVSGHTNGFSPKWTAFTWLFKLDFCPNSRPHPGSVQGKFRSPKCTSFICLARLLFFLNAVPHCSQINGFSSFPVHVATWLSKIRLFMNLSLQDGQTRVPDDADGPAASEWRRGTSFIENGSSTVSQYWDDDDLDADGPAAAEEGGCDTRKFEEVCSGRGSWREWGIDCDPWNVWFSLLLLKFIAKVMASTLSVLTSSYENIGSPTDYCVFSRTGLYILIIAQPLIFWVVLYDTHITTFSPCININGIYANGSSNVLGLAVWL